MNASRAVTVLVCAGAIAIAAPAAAATRSATTRVSYIAGGSIYLQAGRLDGIDEADTLQAVHDGRMVAFLVVRFLSSHRAACDTLHAIAMPAVGDEVWYQARGQRPQSLEKVGGQVPAVLDSGAVQTMSDSAAVAGARPAEGPSTPRGAAGRRLRGRIGARYLIVDPSIGTGYSQPALDLRLDGANLGGRPLDVAVDVRSHRTYHGADSVADDGEARVYRMSATLHDAVGHRRVTLGRQLSTSLASVSMFDGVLLEGGGERWSAGLFSGAQPDPISWSVDGAVFQHGAYVGLQGRNGTRRWNANGGGVASFDRGRANRQYAFLAGSYFDPRLSLSWAEELDLNAGWKRALGEPTLSLTSTFVSAHARVSRGLSLQAGYDNRRSVRLYRDRWTPETEFDDRHRQGAWLGSSIDWRDHVRVSADGRWSGGGTGGDLRSWSASGEAFRLPWLQADIRWRSTRFSGLTTRGWLHAAGLGVRPWGRTRVDLNGGERISDDGLVMIRTRLRWEGVDLDLGLAGHWYLLLSAERQHGEGVRSTQGYGSLSWMF